MFTPTPSCRHCACETGCCAKERLLNTCVRLLLSCGCESVTTRRLAEEAEVNHALIAYHFGGMAQLTDAAVQQVEARLHIELVPEIELFTATLATATPDTLRPVFEDACTRLVDFLLIRAREMDFSRYLLEHRTCTHKLHHLYARLMLQPVMEALSTFIAKVWDASTDPCSAQDVFIQANIILSQLLLAAHLASGQFSSEKACPNSMPVADPHRATRQIVRSLLASLDVRTTG